mmetsp:Transcript_26580/g.56158  ORF Transcript_26580/g.56158 Transcript_26580/m.56158 type:complete len:149 (-) Transcript_26580:1245-1691(-)
MKVNVIALTLAISAGSGAGYNFIVNLKNIGHVNDNGGNYENFSVLKGDLWCVGSRGCVGSGIIKVARSGSNYQYLDIEAYPNQSGYFSISVMCEISSQSVKECTAECSQSRSSYCPDPSVILDSYGDGCTVSGSSYSTQEVEVNARCA